ncbi:unnamed protein product [Adineta steineri]|uniref:EGF-like domain-containing protein n=1 Tax=Adineta steineri TaxID=433720 RepID=A0A816B647_9BILA|nr:unnamed protein product [Adineta steineri]CAF1604718.1 unnamed protein product [Adineta steineri]
MCDGFIEVNFDAYVENRETETDETNCDYWPCDNVYTRCDGFWNCENGLDELNCQASGSNDCAADQFQCVSHKTFSMMCLNVSQAGDKKMDCLGGVDEPFYCRNKYLSFEDHEPRRYRCWDTDYCVSLRGICLESFESKEADEYCLLEKKERFCIRTNLDEGCYGDDIDYTYDSHGDLSSIDKVNQIHEHFCNLEDWMKQSVVPFALEFSETVMGGVVEYIHMSAPNLDWKIVWFCNRGIVILERNVRRCLCPPSYYGEQCQYQSQRVIDNTSFIHSHEQRTFVAARDCDLRFDLVLLYANRPKDESKTYDVIIHVFEMLNYRNSWQLPVRFPSLPVLYALSYGLYQW